MDVVHLVNVRSGYGGEGFEDLRLFWTLILLGQRCEACEQRPDNVHNVHNVHRLGVADTRSVDFRELGTLGGLAESDIMNDHEGGQGDK